MTPEQSASLSYRVAAVQQSTGEQSESESVQFSTQDTRAGKHENFILLAPKLVSGAFKRAHSRAAAKLFFAPEILTNICSKELYYVAYEAHLEAKACEESRTDVGSGWRVIGADWRRVCKNQRVGGGYTFA